MQGKNNFIDSKKDELIKLKFILRILQKVEDSRRETASSKQHSSRQQPFVAWHFWLGFYLVRLGRGQLFYVLQPLSFRTSAPEPGWTV